MGDKIKKEVTPLVLKYVVPDGWDEAEKEKNPIYAKEVVEAVKGGKRIEIINAVIEGPFILKSLNAENEITIQRTKIRGTIDWSYATFKRVLNLENSIFEADAIFKGITAEKDIFLNNVAFKKKAIFKGTAFRNIEFTKSIFEGETDFESAQISGDADFTEAQFKQEARFVRVHNSSCLAFVRALFKQKANFNSAQIDGAAYFEFTTFCDEAEFIKVRIGGNAKGNAQFEGACFKKLADFDSAQIDGHALFSRYLFSWDEISGNDKERFKEFLKYVGIDIDWVSAKIEKVDEGRTIKVSNKKNYVWLKLNDEKNEVDLKIDSGRIYKFIVERINNKRNIYNPATFEEDADFESAQIGGDAELSGVLFKQKANFDSAHISGNVGFNRALFKQKANFNAIQIDGPALFDSTTFAGEADFESAQIGGDAKFQRAVFKQNANFCNTQIKGDAFFNQATFEDSEGGYLFSWDDDVRLMNFLKQNYGIDWVESAKNEKVDDGKTIKVSNEKNYVSLKLNEEKNEVKLKIDNGRTDRFIVRSEDGNLNIYRGWKADFSDAKIGGDAEFDGAMFKQSASFYGAQIEGYINLEETVFTNIVSQPVITRIIEFIRAIFSHKIDLPKIDLRGCKYDYIKPETNWKELMKHLYAYDRQPFTQLEKTFRQAGKDNLADDVYYEGRCREFTKIRKFTENNNPIRRPFVMINRIIWLLKDRFLWALTGYGVKIKRLLIFIVPILVLGAIIYHQPGAVVLKPNINQTTIIRPQDSLIESFWVSLNLFLPVEIPSGAYWDSAPNFTSVGTFLKLAGWILVPIGVAGISGLLKRKSED